MRKPIKIDPKKFKAKSMDDRINYAIKAENVENSVFRNIITDGPSIISGNNNYLDNWFLNENSDITLRGKRNRVKRIHKRGKRKK